MAEKTKSINLLPNHGEGLLDQFFNWALTIGRLLIILTETLALGTFLYRFSLDMRISDLHDQIKNQSAIVYQFKSTEDQARSLQARLALVQQYDSTSSITPSVFAEIIEMGRGHVTFNDLNIADSDIKIVVQAANSTALNTFFNKLKNYPQITSVSVDSVDNKTSLSLISMNISARLKQAGAKKVDIPEGGVASPATVQP